MPLTTNGTFTSYQNPQILYKLILASVIKKAGMFYQLNNGTASIQLLTPWKLRHKDSRSIARKHIQVQN